MRRVVEVVEGYRRDAQNVEEMSFIGETEKSINGYSLAVRSVRMDYNGLRIRLELIKDGIARRSLDTTTELVARVIPFLLQAAELGGPVESLRDEKEWWSVCTVQQVRDRVAAMNAEEATNLLGELNAASSLAEESVRLSKAAAQDVARASVIHAKKRAVKRVVHRLQQASRVAAPKDKMIYLQELGRVLRERLGAEAADSIFTEAKLAAGKKFHEQGV